MFKDVSNKTNFPKDEEETLQFWDKEKIFEQSVTHNPESETYFFYDGPPFATGLPHYGHILAGTIKDVVPRYQTMRGKRIERRFGWDCHGLPVEFEVEKELGLKGKEDIDKMGIAAFNEKCRSIVLRYTKEWKNTVRRMGRWVDVEHDYKTMDADFMESIWWVFKTLWEKGLIYESGKIVAYSTRLMTPLSNFEVNLGYRDVSDPSITIKFKLKDRENTYMLAWTTTPWTLPSNLALTVAPDVVYVKVEREGSYYYLAKDLVEQVFDGENPPLLEEVTGRELEGWKYEPLFPFFSELADQGAYRVTLGDYVSTETGTGIVHTAPNFGEDDYQTGKKYNLPELMPMADNGEFSDLVADYAGIYFKDADKQIIRDLKTRGLILKHESLKHSYPFCWRSDTPLMYRSIRTWFVAVEKIKEKLQSNNQLVHWSPDHIKNGRMGKWLEGARDWAISRNRYWGAPIPVWICTECDHRHCIGSREELESLTGEKVDDLHRHFIDHLKVKCEKCGSEMNRIHEVLDCWFESGSMPYGQQHYPFKNKKKFDSSFPADFISEGLDQTRGWFYTLMVLSTALFEKPAFMNCIVSGMVLAEDGKKMSKSQKNYPDPWEMINQYGADAIRLYMLNSGAISADELRFSEEGLKETLRNTMIPLWNSLSFFTTYANIDQWTPIPAKDPKKFSNPLDLWIMSRLHSLIKSVRENMDQYNLNKSVQPLVGLISGLTNWYIRRSRRRFWKSEHGEDKDNAYQILYTVLLELSKVIAPFVPFLAENIYRVLRTEDLPASVHLCSFPEVEDKWHDSTLEEEMEIILKTVTMGRALRTKTQLKIRQPLQSVTLVTKNSAVKGILGEMAELIRDELNVKEVNIAENEEDLVEFSAKPNLKILGPKLGKKLGEARGKIMELSSTVIAQVLSGKTITISVGEDDLQIGEEELFIQRDQKEGLAIQNEGDLTIALDTKLTDDLVNEGFARDFVNKVQITRKERDFAITDRIDISFSAENKLVTALEKYDTYIKQETLADSISISKNAQDFVEWEVNGQQCFIKVDKI